MKPIFYLLLIVMASQASAQTIIRGPYLNLATRSGIVIRWKTDVATDSKVNFGTTAGNLSQSVVVDTFTNEHIVQLTGLAVNTKYFYSIGSTSQILQGDADNYFRTAPSAVSNQKVRILAMGDMGNNSTSQVNVRNAYLNYNGTKYTDIWMLLGDNAYEQGTESNYNTNFFNIYQQNLTKNHVLWPAPGNHDYANNAARQADHNIAYYKIFSLPSNSEAGGVASNTEAYYSYNYGNIHFVSLDSYGWETGSTRLYDTLGLQVKWLKQDLAANNQKWTVVYFHHPPYTKGSHDSDLEPELISMRQNVVRILERYKVDLVLNGHSHSYERSYLINGHYGLENTFNSATHALSSSTGKYDGSTNSCPYIKNSSEVRNGIVYAVVGSSGKIAGSSLGYPHQAMQYSNVSTPGAMVIEIENNRLDAKWICSDGVIRDNFTMMKQVNKNTDTTVTSASRTTLSASWIGNYTWSTGETTRTITISPSTSGVYTVRDNANCLADTFNVTVPDQTSIIKLNPVADAYTRDGSYAEINYGEDTDVVVKSSAAPGYSRATYLKFQLNNVGKVKEAVLRLYGSNINNSSAINISAFAVIDDSWTEQGITWNNAPASLTPSVSNADVSGQLKYYEFNVTDFVKSENTGDNIVTFSIKDTANQIKNLVFNSKENINFKPELLITLDPASQSFSSSPDVVSKVAHRSNSFMQTSARSNSATAVARFSTDGNSEKPKVYPNPINNRFTIQFPVKHMGAFTLQIVDPAGKRFELGKYQLKQGERNINLNISSLSLRPGVYFLKINSNIKNEFVKLIVQ